jgi:hypothetical protein
LGVRLIAPKDNAQQGQLDKYSDGFTPARTAGMGELDSKNETDYAEAKDTEVACERNDSQPQPGFLPPVGDVR